MRVWPYGTIDVNARLSTKEKCQSILVSPRDLPRTSTWYRGLLRTTTVNVKLNFFEDSVISFFPKLSVDFGFSY